MNAFNYTLSGFLTVSCWTPCILGSETLDYDALFKGLPVSAILNWNPIVTSCLRCHNCRLGNCPFATVRIALIYLRPFEDRLQFDSQLSWTQIVGFKLRPRNTNNWHLILLQKRGSEKSWFHCAFRAATLVSKVQRSFVPVMRQWWWPRSEKIRPFSKPVDIQVNEAQSKTRMTANSGEGGCMGTNRSL